MQNIKCTVKGNKLLITINLEAKTKKSASGKTLIVASSRGNKPIEGTDMIMGLNIYKYPDSK